MSTVYNWQLGRAMDYPWEVAYPDRQFAFVCNLNRCIGCQSCTMACNSTWTAGAVAERFDIGCSAPNNPALRRNPPHRMHQRGGGPRQAGKPLMKNTIQRTTFIQRTLIAGLALSLTTTLRAAEAPAAEPVPKPPPPWEVSGNAGFTATSGNSETLLATAGIIAKRTWESSNLDLGLNGAYGENEKQRNVQSVRGFGQYDRKVTDRVFWYGRGELLHDGIADIEYRLTLGPGAGYYFIKKENLFLRGEFGPAWVYERRGQVTRDYFTLRFGERFEYQLSDRARVYQSLEWLPQVDRWSNYLLNFEAGVESALTDKLSLTFVFVNSYFNEPAPGRERNDSRFIAGLKYRFL